MGRTSQRPISMGKEVPTARRRINAEVSSWKKVWARVEKKKAERPKPERTRPFTVALCQNNTVSDLIYHSLPWYELFCP
jgi:hypothetical protein